MLSELVTMLIRAAATKYVSGIRQMWLFGLSPESAFAKQYFAARLLRYPSC